MLRLFKKPFIVFSVAVLLSTGIFNSVSATVDTAFYSRNDILFSGEDATCATGTLALSGSDNRQKIYNYLTAKGLNADQAAGVLGNLQTEAGFSPTRHEEGKAFNLGGYGIAQWTFGRRDSVVAALQSTNASLMVQYYNSSYSGAVKQADGYVPRDSSTGNLMPIGDNDALLNAELDFLFHETTARRISSTTAGVTSAKAGDNEWDALKSATSIEDATKIWVYNFEIPADIAATAAARTTSATTILSELKAQSLTSPTSGCASATSGSVSALQATVKLYAWPSYHKAVYVDKKPEYAAAVTKAQQSGGYVGGINYAGIDCGGFITRAMIDSGYEPSYNAAKGGTTAQKTWLDANWKNLGNAGSIDVSTLQPGDVAISSGHTFMFVGTNMGDFGSNDSSWHGVASASLDERAPMAGHESLTDSAFTWYRKKVSGNE